MWIFRLGDYGYSGGLPIAGSEELALKLMGYALDKGYGFGMHYCSLDNKHRSEMRQKNERAAHVHPCVVFDEDNFFLRTAKVFGPDRAPAKAALEAAGCTDFMEDGDERSLAFPPRFAEVLENAANPETGEPFEVADCLMVAESENGSSYLMEVALEPRVVG